MIVAQLDVTADFLQVLARVVGLALLSGALGIGVGAFYRWYTREQVPEGLAVLAGLSAVAVYLNTEEALGDVIGGNFDVLSVEAALLNVGVFAAAGLAASAGGRVGDRLGESALSTTGGVTETNVSRIVRTVGRVITVELPDADDIEDVVGYDPVGPDVKETLGGQTLVFPRRLTVEELRERLVARLRTDYGVGHVDVDLAEDGRVEYLAVGSREAGLGPTLPPETVAVAVRADPAFAASPGDVVQVWTTGAGPPESVAVGEVRGTAGDVVTLAVDAADAERLAPEGRYRLVTLPVESRADREFVSVLRAADETMGVTTIAQGSPLVETPVSALDVSVVAVRPADGGVEAIPPRTRPLAAGETVYTVARPDELRKLEAAAAPRRPDRTTDPVAPDRDD